MLIVPALTPTTDGGVQYDLLKGYINRAKSAWVDAFLLSGSTTRGDLLTIGERARIIDQWLTLLPAERLIACCWNLSDVKEASARNVAPMMVMQNLADKGSALSLFAELPDGAYIYSHPMYSPTVFNAELAAAAMAQNVLPGGGKIAKIGGSRAIAELRAAAGAEFALWDGSSRHIAESIAAGASGVIATPLSHLPAPFPPPSQKELQTVIDENQAALDALPDRPQRTALLMRQAFG